MALGRAMELSGLANCLATALVALTRPLGAGAVKLGYWAMSACSTGHTGGDGDGTGAP